MRRLSQSSSPTRSEWGTFSFFSCSTKCHASECLSKRKLTEVPPYAPPFSAPTSTKDYNQALKQGLDAVRAKTAWLQRDAKDVEEWLKQNGACDGRAIDAHRDVDQASFLLTLDFSRASRSHRLPRLKNRSISRAQYFCCSCFRRSVVTLSIYLKCQIAVLEVDSVSLEGWTARTAVS